MKAETNRLVQQLFKFSIGERLKHEQDEFEIFIKGL